ncbi:amino acid adenylation domain-containing protein [Streptomyces niveiscabiei]|uniref:amino acid adenylation domain-containing protein n=3 Tax=Streptomyces niveiscabiei TaxID=164115 RepID=UPI003EC14367
MTTSSEQRGTAAPAGGLTDAKKALLALRLHGRPAARPAGTARGAGIPGLPPGTPAPLAPVQHNLWVADRMLADNSAFSVHRVLRLTGPLEHTSVQHALDRLVERHAALRTTFQDGRPPTQTAHPPRPAPLRTVTLGHLPPAARRNAARRLAEEELAQPFDLAAGPVFRALLVALDDTTHLLVLNLHHCVADEWSCGILAREFGALYAAHRAGEPDALPALPVTYADYSAWQSARLTGDLLAGQLAHWRGLLEGVAPVLELPADRPRPPVPSFRGHSARRLLSPEASAALRAYAAGHRVTLFTALLSLYGAFLHRWSGGQERFSVLAPVAGRTTAETEPLVGMFANTLPLPLDHRGTPDFSTLLKRANTTVLDALEHQDVTFEQLVTDSGVPRDVSRNPLSQVMFQCIEAREHLWELPGVTVERERLGGGSAKVDLSLIAVNLDEGVQLDLVGESTLFEPGTVERMLDSLVEVVTQALAAPDAPVHTVRLTDDAAWDLVVRTWNGTGRDLPDGDLLTPIEEQAARTPRATALECGGDSLDYGAMDERANRLAHHLRSLGAGPGAVVAVSVPRSVDLVVALLAVLKTGAAYLPLDPDYPGQRLTYMLEDAAPVCAVADHAGRLSHDAGVPLVVLDGLDLSSSPATAPARSLTPVDPAYVIYTSGSTGRPKGVVVSHRAIANRLRWGQGTYRLTPADRVLQKTPSSFDVSVWEFFWPLREGATLLLAEPGGHRDPDYLARLIRERAVTVCHFVPSMLQAFLASAGAAGCRHTLRQVFASGEALLRETVNTFARTLPGVELHNLYGPTEAAIEVAHHTCAPDGTGPVPIGRPVWNTRLHVLDAHLHPCPPGMTGELYLAGVQLADGYHDRPGLTADRFVPEPFGPPGARMYRTGDLVRWTQDGEIEYLGRTDHQLKLRGQRVELGEIEARLGEHPGVAQCVVVPRETPTGTSLVAYVVGTAAEDELRGHLSAALPAVMVPSFFVPLDSLPLSPSGKADRSRLPDPALPTATAAVPLADGTQSALAALWTEVLGTAPSGPDDSFFELGGDSVSAIYLVSRAREAGYTITVRQVFDHQTLAALASVVKPVAGAAPERRPTPDDYPLAGLDQAELDRVLASAPPGDVQDIYPLTPLQAGMLFQTVHDPDGSAYVTQYRWEIDGDLDADTFVAAWRHVVGRHDALRCSFRWADVPHPLQVVHRAAPPDFQVLDWRGTAPDDLDRRLDTLLADERRRGFALSDAPPHRFHLVRTGARSHQLIWHSHHILADGWSVGPVLSEVFATHTALRDTGETPRHLPEPVPHRAYVAWLGEQDQDTAELYWRTALAGVAEPTPIPVVRPATGEAGGETRSAELALPAEVIERLNRLARARRCTVGTVLQAAWALLLGRWSRRTDVLFGLTVSGRSMDLPQVERMVGLLTNTVPVRVRWDENETLGDWLGRLGGQLAGLRDVEHCALSDVHGWSAVPRERLLFDSIVVFQNLAPVPRADLGGLDVRMGRVRQSSGFPLMLNARFAATGAVLELIHEDDRVDPADAERLLASLGHLLTAFADRPEARLRDLSAVPGDEYAGAGIAPTREFPHATSVPAMLAAQTARTPDAVAVVSGGRSLTYGELDARAAGLAALLRAAGAGAGDRVAVRVERSADLLVAVSAVWRAGAAYVPLDPEYPAERAAYVVADSGATVLLVSGETPATLLDACAAVVRVEDAGTDPGSAGPTVLPDDLAYVLYTSGSTGRPKGVEVSHRSLALLIAAMGEVLGSSPDDVWLGLTALSFDISTVELLLPLTTGGRVVVVPEEDRWDGAAQRELVRAHRVTHVQATPSGWRLLLAAGFGAGDGVRVGLTGGEALPDRLARRLTALLPRLVNVYGPTEATVWATCEEITADSDEITVGRPLVNYSAHVLDDALRPMPDGAPGELFLGGAGVARGYHGRAALTAERFVPDPFGPPGARLYRTGDLVARRTDGRLRYLGRTDHQVKVSGHRIELGEIEEVLARHPDVTGAAVTVWHDDAGEAFLAAHLTGRGLDVAQVRGFLREELPRAMVPARLIVLDRMPLSPAGKVDRAALPAPDAGPSDPARRIAPRTAPEQALADVWREVLGVPEVGVTDDFFALGGTSVKAVMVTARARERGIALTTRQIFAHPTVEALAALEPAPARASGAPDRPFALAPLEADDLAGLLEAAGPGAVEDVLPLSPLQTGLLLHTLAESGDYVRAFAVDVDLAGDSDADAFEAAWRHLTARHTILRSTFHWAGLPHPVQVVLASAPPVFVRADLTDLPEERRAERLAELTDAERHTVFDLSAAPPARFLLIRTGPERWRFVWTTHHIVFDGWSLHALFAEAFDAYRHLRDTGRLPDAPPPPRYRDYLALLAGHAAQDTDDDGRGLGYWRTALAGFTRPTPLPGSRPTGVSAGSLTERHTVAPELLGALEDAARRHHVTVATLVHAAWAVLLSRAGGERDVVFGTTLSGRFGDVPGIERMVGLLMNTLPLRLDTDPGLSPTGLLRAVHERITDLAGREHLALGDIQRVSDVPGGRRLFDSLVVFTDVGDSALPEGVSPVPDTEVRDTGYPLVLEAVRSGALTLELTCDLSRFDAATASRLLEQTVRLLGELTEERGSVAELSLLSDRERELVVRGWNATGADFPAGRTLHSLIEEQAARTPQATAVRFGGDGLTYAELDARADRVARRLRGLGAGAGTLVALCTERSLEHVIGLLGILKAGAAFVPVDPEHPVRRQAYVLADAQARAVLTQRHLLASLPRGADTAVPVLALDDPAEWPDAPAHGPVADALPADLCSLYYTSGSTGRPKGVASTHQGWVNRMWWMQRRHGLRPGDAVLHKTTLTFDDAAVEILWPLMTGGQVVLLAPGAHRDTHAIAEAVTRYGVVHVQFVPSVLEVFLDVLTVESAQQMGRLRSVLTSGEALRPALVRRFLELFGDRVSLDNTWGATEVSIDSTFHVCGAADAAAEGGAVSLGRPFDNNTVYVLDEELAPLPVGVAGELFIGGTGLARGYHGRPALTAERFVPDPFGPPGARLYRTGDLGRWRADGTLEFGGRTDHQVKIGGVRVELGEIEDALRRAPGVRDAVVDVRAVDGAKVLVGYTTGGVAAEVLRAALRAELPDALVPNAFVAVDAVPLNANGKVDRAALPDPAPEAGGPGGSYVAPRTPTEEALAGIWARVLRAERVGVHDNFRVMGGDSILLIHTVARAREAGLALTPRMVFEHPTVAELAAAVDAAASRGRAVEVHAEQGPVTGEVPLGPIQARYAELGLLDRFNQSLLLAVPEEVGADTLRTALAALVGHHDALRLRWTREVDGPRQYLAGDEPADLLTVVDTAEEEAAAVEAAHAGLDLVHGPLLRAVLLRGTGRLLLVVHHLAVDTVSWNILAEDLATLCAGDDLPAKTTSVQYWARSLARHAVSEDFDAEAAYWTLPAPPVAALPADRAGGADTEGRARSVRVVLPAAETEALLRQASAAYGAQPDHLMLAALVDTIAGWTGGDTVAVDVERHGREALFDDVDLSRTVGWFTGVQPLVVTVPGSGAPEALVAAVREHLRGAPGGGIGHGLARYLRPATRAVLEGRPHAEVCFNYHGRRDTDGGAEGPLRPLPQSPGEPVDPGQRRAHPVEVDAAVLAGELHVVWRYAADRFDAATVEELAGRQLRRLSALVAHGRAPGAVRRPVEPFVERLFAGAPAPLLPMLRHRVPGVGIAVVADTELRGAWGFGRLGADDPAPVDARTLFQVGSISKHVTALAVMRLVQEGRLDLDTDVDRLLTGWRLPGEGGVTLRHLLSHTSGLGEQAYHGYGRGDRMPGLREVLDGRPPAVSSPVHAVSAPGSGYLYSSSNYSVVQQVLQDVTGQPFPALLKALVLDPLGMADSDFAPDAPHRYGGRVALNHRADGTAYPEGWRLYPESAAGGLWSTPADVARVAIEIQRAVTGGPAAFLTADAAAEMLRPVPGAPGGLGTIGKPYGDRRWFGHTGGVPGFRSLTWADPDRGLGLVVTSNSDAGEDFLRELLHELGVGLEDARW